MIRVRLHTVLAEFYGRVAGRALLKMALHAHAIKDDVTFERARLVIEYGHDLGWSDESFDKGKVIPNRQPIRPIGRGLNDHELFARLDEALKS